MNYIDGDMITLDVALSKIRDEKGKTYLCSLMKEKYLSGESVIPARDSGIFFEYAKVISKCGLDKTRALFYPRIVSKFIDPDKLHEARIKAIPKMIGWNRDFTDDAVKAYYNENEQFRNAYDEHLFKSEIEQCKMVWRPLNLSDDDIITLYSIAGTFRFNGDLLCRLPHYKEGDERISLYMLTIIKSKRTDLFIKLFEGYDILTQLDLFSSLGTRDIPQNTGGELCALLIPGKEDIDDFLYLYLLSLMDKDEPEIAIVQAVFPMLYKHKHFKAGRFIKNIIQEFSGIELVEKIAAKAANFPAQEFFPVESFQDYQSGDMGCFEYTVFKRYLDLVKPSGRDDILRLARYWHQLIHNQEISIRSENMAADFPILDSLIAPYFDGELLHDLLRISLDSGKEEAYLYDYQWFAHFTSIFLLSSEGKFVKKASTKKAIEKVILGKPRSLPENILTQISQILRNNNYRFNDESSYLLYLLHVQGCKDPESALAFCEEAYQSIARDKRICYQLYCLALEKKQPFYLEDHLFDIPFDLFVYPIVDDPAFFPAALQSLYEKTGVTYKDRREMLRKIEKLCAAIIDRKDDAGMRNQIKASSLEMCLQRAEQDTSGNHIELFTLLQIEYIFPEEWAALPEGKKEWLYKTCSTFLNTVFSKMQIEQWEPVFEFVIAAAWHISQKSLWRGLNPLMRAFRNSKTPLVNPDLSPKHALIHEIMRFFKRSDQDALRQLRFDMAHDFIKYLKPDAKEKRNQEDYTPLEQEETGFDETYNEPSPLFRYAYVRALADLEVKGERGHFYKSILEEYQKNDPSPDVQSQLKKTIKRLDFLRDSISPGRHTQRLYEAFWWLRQAHLLSLGQVIDAEESRKTRIREWRERDM